MSRLISKAFFLVVRFPRRDKLHRPFFVRRAFSSVPFRSVPFVRSGAQLMGSFPVLMSRVILPVLLIQAVQLLSPVPTACFDKELCFLPRYTRILIP